MTNKPARIDADFENIGLKPRGNVMAGMLWMLAISILFFWLPAIGPFVAGIVGGKKSGGVGNALLAAFLPCLVLMALLYFFATLFTGLPILGALLAMGGFVFYTVNLATLFLGAILGGAFA